MTLYQSSGDCAGARPKAIHIFVYMRAGDRLGKAEIFCVRQVQQSVSMKGWRHRYGDLTLDNNQQWKQRVSILFPPLALIAWNSNCIKTSRPENISDRAINIRDENKNNIILMTKLSCFHLNLS